MAKKNLEVLMDGKKEYVSLSVKVVDIHLSDCINTSPKEPITVDGGTKDEEVFYSGSVGRW